jgi:hypothetical protein
MDTLLAKELKIFDWDKAAQLFNKKPDEIALAGLASKQEWTGYIIYGNGKPRTNFRARLASTCATPVLFWDDEFIPCYKMQHEVPDWGEDTIWPQSALNILKGGSSDERD